MTRVMFDIVYFPVFVLLLRLLIRTKKELEIDIGVESREDKTTHMITIKIDSLQLGNFRASEDEKAKTRGIRQLLVHINGQCYSKDLRGEDRWANVTVEYKPLQFEGTMECRTMREEKKCG